MRAALVHLSFAPQTAGGFSRLPFLLVLLIAGFARAAVEPPRLNASDGVNPVPRPYPGRTEITTRTTIYFEVLVPNSNGSAGAIDPNSITATLIPQGGWPVPLLYQNQVFARGYSGTIWPAIESGSDNGCAVYIVPATPLDAGRLYRVRVRARTVGGVQIPAEENSWSWTTRRAIGSPTVSWSVSLAEPLADWSGGFFSGFAKPNAGTSRLLSQMDTYALMDAVRARQPSAWTAQKDWPLTGDYWREGPTDGQLNLVREAETRRITAVTTVAGETHLSTAPLEEGPLFGISPLRSLAADYPAGHQVTVADREKSETATVLGVDEATRTVRVSLLAAPASAWITNPEAPPAGDSSTPGSFPLPPCALRKLSPRGTLMPYWARLDDEWDLAWQVHGQRPVVSIAGVPLDLARTPVPDGPSGGSAISPPKDWLQWHEFVGQLVLHLIDRYGAAAASQFLYSVGHENNRPGRWSGTTDEFLAYYDVTVDAVLHAFEMRGENASAVRVGGVEAGNPGARSWIRDVLYHASPAAPKPGGGIAETNFVCSDARFAGSRAARTAALCGAGGLGAPLDFVSVHEFAASADIASEVAQVRLDATGIDAPGFATLDVHALEASPERSVRTDPAARRVFLGSGFFPSWAADLTQRLVEAGASNPALRGHRSAVFVWPDDVNAEGRSSVTGQMRVDDDGDGKQDRIATIRKDIFNALELSARMQGRFEALPERIVGGMRLSGVRSASVPGPAAKHWIQIQSHDPLDTESRETATVTVQLTLSSVPWRGVRIRRWRVDRTHSNPLAAWEALPRKALYGPGETAALEAADELVEDGPALDLAVRGGTLPLSLPLPVNAIVFLEISEVDSDEDGVPDSVDNCPAASNPSQADRDSDRVGDLCDNCIGEANPDQIDSDGNSFGNACEWVLEWWVPDSGAVGHSSGRSYRLDHGIVN